MPILFEGQLKFSFLEQWAVMKFDTHRFYRYLSGQGLKGVDFIGINKAEDQLILMEVKNFDPIEWEGTRPTMESTLEDPQGYAKAMAHKFDDSLQLIRVIQKYYRKRWWARGFSPLLKKLFPWPRLSMNNFVFWDKAREIILEKPDTVILVLWIDFGEDIEQERVNKFNEKVVSSIEKEFSFRPFQIKLASLTNAVKEFSVSRSVEKRS